MGQGPVWRRSGLADVTKIAILDDYIGVALDYGDWTVLPNDAEITVYRQAIPPERLVDFFSGIYLLLERPFRVGDTIRVKDQQGVVENIGVRTTELRTSFTESFEAAFFYDAGNLWSTPTNIFEHLVLRQAVGTGLRWLTPIGRVAFDIGFNLDPDPLLGEPQYGFYFSINGI